MLDNMPYTNLNLMIKEIEEATAAILVVKGYDSEYRAQFLHELIIKLYNIDDKIKNKRKNLYY